MSHTPTNPGQHQSVSQSQTDHNPLKDDEKGDNQTPQFVILLVAKRSSRIQNLGDTFLLNDLLSWILRLVCAE